MKLRKKNPELKVLLSIMHFSNGSHSNEGFPGVVANKNNLDKYVLYYTYFILLKY